MIKKLLLLLCLATPLFAQDISGAGTVGDPYLLYNTADFDSMRYYDTYDTYYSLQADLDFSAWGEFAPFDTANTFFNGNNHTISNMTIEPTGYVTTYVESFGLWRTAVNGTATTIQDVVFSKCSLNVINTTAGKAPAAAIVVPDDIFYGKITLTNITARQCIVTYNYITALSTSSQARFSILGSASSVSQSLVWQSKLIVDIDHNQAVLAGFVSSSGQAGSYLISMENYMYLRNRNASHNINASFVKTSWYGQGGGSMNMSIKDTLEGNNDTGLSFGGITYQFSKGAIIGNNPIFNNMYCAEPTFINVSASAATIKLDVSTVTNCDVTDMYVDSTNYSTAYYPAFRTEKDTLLDSTKLTNFNFTTTWDMDKTGLYGYYPVFQTGMPTVGPYYTGTVEIYSPTIGESFLQGETVPINIATTLVDTLEIAYSDDAGGSWNIIVADTILATDTLLYTWTPTLGINGTIIVRAAGIGLIDSTFDISDNFYVLTSANIEILTPQDSSATASVGDTVSISVEVQGIDSLSLFYAVGDTSNWILIEGNIEVTPSYIDTIYYNWILPNIHGIIWLKAANAIDTALYIFDKPISFVGENMPSQPQICWSDGTDYWGSDLGWGENTRTPFMWARVLDPSCGWGINVTRRHTTYLKDDGTGYDFYYDPSGNMSYADMRIYGAFRNLDSLGLYTVSDTTYYEIDELYTYGDTITYKYRRYYYDNTDSSLRCDDLRNNIDSIFVADLSYARTNYWRADPSFIQVYNVQSSKISGIYASILTNLESLNDPLFGPIILISGASVSVRGYVTVKLSALGIPPSTDLVQDVVRMFTNLNITRDYFRGIDPKARKKGR